MFKDRQDAGRQLADALSRYADTDAVVYALPRGGVVLGYEIAKKLRAPLDLVITRKIGHPSNPEYAVCAVAEDGDMVCDEAERAALDKRWLKIEAEKERQEAKRRRETYLGGRKMISAKERTAILVDDGIATGLTMLLAIREVKHQHPNRVVVAIPVVPKDTAKKIQEEADELVALSIPFSYLGAVGAYYADFRQVNDEEVLRLLSP